MKNIYAIVHKDGLILSLADNVETTEDGLLITASSLTQSENPYGMGMVGENQPPSKNLIQNESLYLVSPIKFDYNEQTKKITAYYTPEDTKVNYKFGLTDDILYKLRNADLSWINNKIV